MNTDLMFSSKTDEWETPDEFFEKLNNEFCFDLDPCANHENHKCKKYFTKKEDGLKMDWGGGIKFFAILHMEEKLLNGLKSAVMKTKNMEI